MTRLLNKLSRRGGIHPGRRAIVNIAYYTAPQSAIEFGCGKFL
jgi:hypothetical protein